MTLTAPTLRADELAEALAQLGPTPEDVARTLRRAGVVGHRECCHACPVARYLLQLGAADVAVDHDVSAVRRDGTEDWTHVENPRAVRLFIENFDSGGYDDLESDSHADPYHHTCR